MDAVEDLPRLDDAAGRSGADAVDCAASGPVDAGEPEDLDRVTGPPAEIEPGCLSVDARLRATVHRRERRLLGDACALPVAVDADGREVTDPQRRRPASEIGAVMAQHGVAGAIGRYGHDDVRHPFDRLRDLLRA